MAKTIIITGASDGIGAAAARAMHKKGHRLLLVGRSPEKLKAIADETSAEGFVADFSRLDEVRRLAGQLDRAAPFIDVLANNAGGVFGERAKTIDGFEKTFQVNHLAPFLLTQLLLPKLLESRASVIQTSSLGARLAGRIDKDDLEHQRGYRATLAYGTAKLENILFTRELHRRFNSHGLSAAAFHPGSVATNFAATSQSILKRLYTSPLGRMFMVTPEKGAEQLVWLSETTPGQDWESGVYFERGRPAIKQNPQVFDDDLARWLWDRSKQLLGMQ